jgi:hypothetical protein
MKFNSKDNDHQKKAARMGGRAASMNKQKKGLPAFTPPTGRLIPAHAFDPPSKDYMAKPEVGMCRICRKRSSHPIHQVDPS